MGGVSSVSNTANIQQTFMNNITQINQQNCKASVSDSANNNVVIVNGANIGGNFTGVAATTSTDATCLMVSAMSDSIESILTATLTQANTAENDIFSGVNIDAQSNDFNMKQSISNNISQINEATCSANNTTSTNNNYVYVTNAKIGGNFIGVTNSASADANCSMQNNMKNTTYNTAQGNANQSNTVKGMFGTMAGAMGAFIGLMVLIVIILFAVGAFGYVGYKATKPRAPPPQQSAGASPTDQLNQLEQQLEGGGLSSFGGLPSSMDSGLSSFGGLPSSMGSSSSLSGLASQFGGSSGLLSASKFL